MKTDPINKSYDERWRYWIDEPPIKELRVSGPVEYRRGLEGAIERCDLENIHPAWNVFSVWWRPLNG